MIPSGNWNLFLSIVLLVEMISYYLVNKKVKNYFSYSLSASFVNLMTVVISYSWYNSLHFYFSSSFMKHDPTHLIGVKDTKYNLEVLTDLIWCICSLLAGRQHWPSNDHQEHFFLPLWQVSWLCFRFYTTNTWWSQRSNRIKQVQITG